MSPAAKRVPCSGRFERAARQRGFQCIAGLDEVGRGALFGPVFASAVVLDPARPIRGLRDSKELDADTREVLAKWIRERALCWAVAAADPFVPAGVFASYEVKRWRIAINNSGAEL